MNHTDYYNRKGWYSIVTQAVVDHNGLFCDLCIGWPGSVHDTRVLSNSRVYQKINDGCLLLGDVLRVYSHIFNWRLSISTTIMAYEAICMFFFIVVPSTEKF